MPGTEGDIMKNIEKPKIYCTLGNATDSDEVIRGMLKSGMAGARINTAYCTIDDYISRINQVKSEAAKLGKEIPVMMDIKGPQLRLHTADSVNYSIEKGIVIPLGFSDKKDSSIDIYLNYDLKGDLKEGDTLLIENGTIITRVIENNSQLLLEILNPGEGVIKDQMGVNIPGRYLNLPHLSAKDRKVIDFSLENKLDYIALSFVRDEKDMKYLREYVNERKKKLKADYNVGLIAKIEDKFGYAALPKIIEEGKKHDGDFVVMVARGDLYNEINYTKLAKAQDEIAALCKKENIPVMIATGVLESMKYNPRPTRAEIGDVWNALKTNPDYLMFSPETSNGKYPVLAVNTLSRIIDEYRV